MLTARMPIFGTGWMTSSASASTLRCAALNRCSAGRSAQSIFVVIGVDGILRYYLGVTALRPAFMPALQRLRHYEDAAFPLLLVGARIFCNVRWQCCRFAKHSSHMLLSVLPMRITSSSKEMYFSWVRLLLGSTIDHHD